jgi:hypothetical protein
MRILFLCAALVCCLCAANPAWAQQPATGIAADQKDIGKVQARVQKYDQAIGVVLQLVRSQPSNVECNGVCYFPSSSKPIAWRCEPDKKCDLHCTVNPPVGGCN